MLEGRSESLPEASALLFFITCSVLAPQTATKSDLILHDSLPSRYTRKLRRMWELCDTLNLLPHKKRSTISGSREEKRAKKNSISDFLSVNLCSSSSRFRFLHYISNPHLARRGN